MTYAGTSRSASTHALSRRHLLRATAAGALVGSGVVAASSQALATATPVAQSEDAAFLRLDGVIREAMVRHNVPGVAVGILHDGQEYTAGYGVTNLNAPYPVDAGTLFQAGSITKTYTATAVMILVEQGKIDLAAPVRRYLPDLVLADDAVAEQVTVHQLLNHTAGWFGDYYGPPPTELEPTVWPWRGDDATTRYVADMRYLPQLAPLGAMFGYNNAAVVLAGHLVEVITGTTYEAALTELVLRPLGMADSYLFPEEAISFAVAAGHNKTGEGQVEVNPLWALPRAVHATGGLVLPIADQLKYARFHLGDGTAPDGTRLLSPERLAEMRTPSGPGAPVSVTANAQVIGAGVGWALEEIDGVRIVTHNGSTTGQQAILALVPERQFAVALLTNSVPNGGDLHYEVATWALREFAGLSTPLPPTEALPEEQLAEYAGRYGLEVDVPGGGGGAQLLEVAVDGGGLSVTSYAGDVLGEPETMSQAGTSARLDFFADAAALVTARGHTTMGAGFVRNTDGAVGWMQWGARVVPRLG
jgi:CubicO group peptidase (beta-lactamase class C family)